MTFSFVTCFRYVGIAFAFRALHLRRYVGIALAFVVDAARLGSSWGRSDIPLALSVRLVSLRRSTTEALSICGSSIQIVPTASCITMSTTTANQAHTLPTVALYSQYASGPVVSQDAAQWWKRCVWKATRRQDKQWEWTGGKGEKASKPASTSQGPRPPIAHLAKHILDTIPQSARTQFGLQFRCGPKEGGTHG